VLYDVGCLNCEVMVQGSASQVILKGRKLNCTPASLIVCCFKFLDLV
jgi:hypothetical protein